MIERPHHNILYAVGKSKLANVVLIPCKLMGDQVRFARDRRSIGRQGRYLDRSDLAESGRMSGRTFSNGRCGLWFLGPLTLLPLLLHQHVDWSYLHGSAFFGSLIGHAVYGILLGLIYAWGNRLWVANAQALNTKSRLFLTL